MTEEQARSDRHHLVIKANKLIQESRFSLSLQQQKIVLFLISQIKPEDEEFRIYEFRIQDFCTVCGIDYANGKNYKALKQAITELAEKIIWITLPDHSELNIRWIDKAKIMPRSGKIQMKLDEDMKPFLLQLKSNFTQYELIWTLRFKSKYSVRLYEYIKSIHFNDLETYTKEIQLNQLKQAMDAKGYTVFCDFHARALKPAVQEINEYSDKILTYDLIKQGRTVVAVRFTIGTKEAHERLRLSAVIDSELEQK